MAAVVRFIPPMPLAQAWQQNYASGLYIHCSWHLQIHYADFHAKTVLMTHILQGHYSCFA